MRKMIIATTTALALGATPALAQLNTSGGLVNVSVQDVSVLNNFLNHDQIAALNNIGVPVTVQVPIGVAANVCGVAANVLAQQKNSGPVSCTAKSGSQALAQSVIKQKLSQKK
jgi:hypothetical protein